MKELVELFFADLVDVELCAGAGRGGGAGAGGALCSVRYCSSAWLSWTQANSLLLSMMYVHCSMSQISSQNNLAVQPSYLTGSSVCVCVVSGVCQLFKLHQVTNSPTE